VCAQKKVTDFGYPRAYLSRILSFGLSLGENQVLSRFRDSKENVPPIILFTIYKTRPRAGRIYYIKGYLYPISYPKVGKKNIQLSFFWVEYVEGYNILILGISKFNILSYPIIISFLQYKFELCRSFFYCAMEFLFTLVVGRNCQ
jgi:hypothetical protein